MRRILTLFMMSLLATGGAFAAPGGSMESLVVQSINGQRQSANKPTLTLDGRLSDVARHHSQFLSQNRGPNGLYRKGIGHVNSSQRFAASRQFGYGRFGENVYAGRFANANMAQRVVQGWLNSKGHRKILFGQWHSVGVGIVKASDGSVFATALFAERSNDLVSRPSTRPRYLF